MKRIVLLMVMVMAMNGVMAQAPNIQWAKYYGGTNYDETRRVIPTVNGGYIVAGYTKSNDYNVNKQFGMGDYWVVKLNDTGDIQWQKSIGGTADDYACSIQQTIDGGYIMCGVTYSNDGDVTGNHGTADFWVVKLAKDPVGINETPTSSITLSPNPTTGIIPSKVSHSHL